MQLDQQIAALSDRAEEVAFEWAVDYKPWGDGLSPQEYARHGFEQGYRRAIKDLEVTIENVE